MYNIFLRLQTGQGPHGQGRIQVLDGEEAIDEAKDYKQKYKGAKAAQYGKRFYKKYKNYKERQETACDNTPPSIRGVCFEFDRFCRALDEHE